MKHNLSKLFITSILLFSILLLIDTVGIIKFNSPLIVLSFLINGFISILLLSSSLSEDGMSLGVIFWFFNSFFLFLIPLLQYLTGSWMFLQEFSEITYANCLILFWIILFFFGYSYGTRQSKKNMFFHVKNLNYHKVNNSKLWIATGLIFVIAIYFIQSVGISSLLLRSQAGIVTALGGWGPLGLIGEYYLRPLPLFLFLFTIYYVRSLQFIKFYQYVLIFISFVLAIGLNFPTATARFYVFAVYLGILIYFKKPNDRNAYLYLLVIVFSLVGSNWIDFTRNMKDLSSIANIQISFNLKYLFAGHFDAYENFIHSINYTKLNGITWGRQLLGVLLFWLPRTIWSDKPIGTGAFVAQNYLKSNYNVTNDNLSAPLIEEFYINFGLPAVLLGSFLLGILFGFLDCKYRASKEVASIMIVPPMYVILYPILVGLSLFVLRGDGMSSFAYTSGIIAAYITLNIFVIKKVIPKFKLENYSLNSVDR